MERITAEGIVEGVREISYLNGEQTLESKTSFRTARKRKGGETVSSDLVESPDEDKSRTGGGPGGYNSLNHAENSIEKN